MNEYSKLPPKGKGNIKIDNEALNLWEIANSLNILSLVSNDIVQISRNSKTGLPFKIHKDF